MSEAFEAGRKLFAGECRFVAGANTLEIIPPATHPEIAFIGRSNVGKSSLINALTGRKALARVSDTPGRTQQLNFFLLGEKLMLVDLPGYGFAKVSKQQVREWTGLIRDYLRGRANLARVFLLIDARRGIMPPDEEFMDMLDEAAVSYQLVLTKADKLKAKEGEKALSNVAEHVNRRPAAHPELFMTSAENGEGIESLRAEVAQLSK